jgi:uncharacterized damage-inducible protein DinB
MFAEGDTVRVPESRQTFQMLAHEYRRCHEAAVRVVDELSDEQFRWRPSAGPQSIGWNLWHIARWDDYTAEVQPKGKAAAA